jgi:hypothetical protein
MLPSHENQHTKLPRSGLLEPIIQADRRLRGHLKLMLRSSAGLTQSLDGIRRESCLHPQPLSQQWQHNGIG